MGTETGAETSITPSGFGTNGTPGATVRTEWKTNDIWLRREFTLLEAELKNPCLWLHHDEDAEVFINGVLADVESACVGRAVAGCTASKAPLERRTP